MAVEEGVAVVKEEAVEVEGEAVDVEGQKEYEDLVSGEAEASTTDISGPPNYQFL